VQPPPVLGMDAIEEIEPMSTEVNYGPGINAHGLISEGFKYRWLGAAAQKLARYDARSVFNARFDSAESMFTQRALTYIATEVYPTLIPPLKARQFIPTAVKANPGASSYVWRKPTRTGMARLFAPGAALDLPVAGMFTEEINQYFYPVGTKLIYDYFELLAIGMALENGQPVDLVGEKLKAALEAVEKKLDIIAAFGTATPPTGYAIEVDADVGITGLLNSTLASVYQTPNGALNSKAWSSKTADEVLADLSGIVAAQRATTFEVHAPDTIILPIAQFQSILSRRLSDVSGESILSYFLRTQREAGQPIDVYPWMYCQGAGSSSSDLMVAFKRDPRMVQHTLNMDATPLEPTKAGLETTQPVVARTAGVILFYPLSVTYGSHI
jgi:hypothetical protein